MTSWAGMMELSAISMFELVAVPVSHDENEAGLDTVVLNPLMPVEYRMNTSSLGLNLKYNKRVIKLRHDRVISFKIQLKSNHLSAYSTVIITLRAPCLDASLNVSYAVSISPSLKSESLFSNYLNHLTESLILTVGNKLCRLQFPRPNKFQQHGSSRRINESGCDR